MPPVSTKSGYLAEYGLKGSMVSVSWVSCARLRGGLSPAACVVSRKESVRIVVVDPLAEAVSRPFLEGDAAEGTARIRMAAELTGAAMHTLAVEENAEDVFAWLESRWASPHWRGPAASVAVLDVTPDSVMTLSAGDVAVSVMSPKQGATLLQSGVMLDRESVDSARAKSQRPGVVGARALPADPALWLSAPLGFPGARLVERLHQGEWTKVSVNTACSQLLVGDDPSAQPECGHVLRHYGAAAVSIERR